MRWKQTGVKQTKKSVQMLVSVSDRDRVLEITQWGSGWSDAGQDL